MHKQQIRHLAYVAIPMRPPLEASFTFKKATGDLQEGWTKMNGSLFLGAMTSQQRPAATLA